MTLIKVLDEETLDQTSYERIRSNAESAIKRILKFTKSIEFEEADNITLDIKIGLLDANFAKFGEANDLLVSIKPENDSAESMEKLYTEIKTELMCKKKCFLESLCELPTAMCIDDEPERLYKNIVKGLYSDAVQATKSIIKNGQGDLITSVVKKLTSESNRNLLSYVYQLWNGDEKTIVEKYMPETFKAIFDGWVTVMQKEYGLALKMDVNCDSVGDRIVWGDSKDKMSARVSWKFTPFWKDNQVFFLIHNLEHHMYLKLAIKADGIGDRGAFGSANNDSDRHIWILEPVVLDEEVLFYIVNWKYSQGLKLQMSVDSYGDRKLWGDGADYHREPAHFAWSIHKDDGFDRQKVFEQLYQNIIHSSYNAAVKMTKDITYRGLEGVITDVVTELAKEGKINLLSYVYQIWIGGAKGVVEKCMPETFKVIFDGWVTPIQKEYGLALKMDVNCDSDGDRIVWGDCKDKTSARVSWKFTPFWKDNQVFFRIHNLEHHMYMKLEIKADRIGDRAAFGSANNDSDRHIWILEPVVLGDEVLFYIVNWKYSQGLKLQKSVDSYGDRKLWGDGADYHREPAHFAWSIVKAQHSGC